MARSQDHQRPNGAANLQKHAPGVTMYEEAEVHLPASILTPIVVFRGPVQLDVVREHLVIGPIGSRSDYLTVTFKPVAWVTTGCFSGPLAAFEEEVRDKPAGQVREEYEAAIALIKAAAKWRGCVGKIPG